MRHDGELVAALTDARPGDHIVLADGSYAGFGDWRTSGAPGAPILVRAATLLGARITSGTFNLAGHHQVLHGIDFVDATCDIQDGAREPRVWRCRFRDHPAPSNAIGLRLRACTAAEIAYCEWVNWAGRGIAVGVAAGARDFTIRRCLFRDAPNQRDARGVQHNGTEAVQLGFGWADAPINSGGRLEECRFVNWNSDDEVVSVKTSNVLVRGNSFERCEGGLWNRIGRFNRFEANEIRDGRGFVNMDGPNIWLGNKHNGDGGFYWAEFSIMRGTNRAADYAGNMGSEYNASEDCIIVGNEIATGLLVGRAFSRPEMPEPVRNTLIRRHVGPISLVPDGEIDTNSQPEDANSPVVWTPGSWLTDADVGPFA